MAHLKTYFSTLFRSALSPASYRQVVSAPFTFSLKFFLVSLLFYALVAALNFSHQTLLPLKSLLPLLPAQLTELYPAELVITIKDGKATTNVTEPFYLSLERFTDFVNSLKQQIKGITTARPTYFLVIDTEATSDDFFNYQTFILLTQHYLVFYNQDGHAEIINLADIPNLTLDQATVSAALSKLTPYLTKVWPSLVVLTVIACLILIPTCYFTLAVSFSLFSLLLGKLFRLGLTYTQHLQITLHLLVPLLFISGLAQLLGLSLNWPDFLLILLVLTSLIVLLTLKSLQPFKSIAPGNGPR
ncbi:hypothetical protein A2W24_04195 [Microgenomates group bacterium RBG_16_45_19]|nr:MAG: hypothetical protein A2W24_04195 [Microgenomates group bacterium RBG_16_45_19]